MKMENIEQTAVTIEQKDSIKLVKNSKGYNWEIRIVAREGIDLLEQIEFVDKKLREKYGEGQWALCTARSVTGM